MPLELGAAVRRPGRRSRRGAGLEARIRAVAASLGVTQALVPGSQSEVDRLHAFRLLAHAEVQQAVEDLARQLLEVTADRGSTGVLTHAGHHLLTYQSLEPLGDKRRRGESRQPVFPAAAAAAGVRIDSASLLAAVRRHEKRIKDNNGVKQGNLRALLLPLGYREEFFPPGFLQQADAFGLARGEVAHASGQLAAGAVNWPTGQGELNAAAAVASGLARLDRYAPRLLMPAH